MHILIILFVLEQFNAHAALLAVEWNFANSPVYRLDECNGIGTMLGPSGFPGLNSLAKDPGGRLFSVVDNITAGLGSDLVTIDLLTGRATKVATLNLGAVAPDVRGLAFSTQGVLFAINNSSSGVGANPDDLFTIDVTTGVGSRVGRTGLVGIQGLDFSPDGTLYGWDAGSGDGIGAGLVRIDTLTGLATDVNGSTSGSGHIQTLAFSPGGTLYGAGDALYRIDVTTGKATLIGGGGYTDLRGLAVLPEAPALAISPAVEICWCGLTNKNYQLQWNSDFVKTWQNFGEAVRGTGSNYCVFDSSPRTTGKRFYRLLALD
jgi:hypothetical protein